MCFNFIGKTKEKNVWGQKVKTLKIKHFNKFHRTAEELRAFNKENDIKLLNLLEYIRRRNDKKIQKGKCF